VLPNKSARDTNNFSITGFKIVAFRLLFFRGLLFDIELGNLLKVSAISKLKPRFVCLGQIVCIKGVYSSLNGGQLKNIKQPTYELLSERNDYG
jgi:hypothetical protein